MIIASQLALYCLLSLSYLSSPSGAYTSLLASSRGRPQQPAFSQVVSRRRTSPVGSTCLFAEEEGGGGEEAEEDAPPAGGDGEHHELSKSKKKEAGDDILNSPAFLKRKLEVLKSDYDAAEKDLEEAKERVEAGKAEWGAELDKLQIEYQNIQQRMNTQSNQGDSMATVQVTRAMLDALDNFDRAFGVVSAETDDEKAIEAEYREAYDSILETFKKLGVEEVETVGKEFDYELHQAVMQRPSEHYEEGIVCEELQKGFKLDDTLVRAAMVVVAA